MTGADLIIGGPAHGSGGRGHLPPTQPRGTALSTDGVWPVGLQAGVPGAVPNVGCTISSVVCDKSLFRDARHPRGTFLQGPLCTEFFFQIIP